jgi:hypothetical protein
MTNGMMSFLIKRHFLWYHHLTRPTRTIGSIGGHNRLKLVFVILNSYGTSTMDITLPPDFKEFLKLFNDHNVRYLLIGGYAVGYYGYPRATNDMDVWVACDPENARRVTAALKAFGFDTPELSPNLFLDDNIIRMGVPPLRIEILTTISGVAFDECYAESVQEEFDGVAVRLISLPRLRQNKQASGRHKDLDDLEHLPA